MQRSLRIERLFGLGNFSNIKFVDEITEIPESVALNQKAVSLITQLQMLEIERAHARYVLLGKTLPATPEQIEKTAEILEQARSRVFEEFLAELNSIRDTNKE
jgi:hypothetical protein